MNKINKLAVFGMGKSGQAAVRLAGKLGLEVYAVDKEAGESCHSQEEFAQRFHEMDEIILSPGISVTHKALKKAVEKGVKISSEIEFAYRETKETPVIAITGTNGKTTTTTMITEALRKAGKKVFCGGNIGVPYCDFALSGEKVDYAVIEVSSFQLETIYEFHPHIGLILNVFPNHSERYDDVHDYAKAKFRLLTNMTEQDHLILGTENPYLDDLENHPVSKSFFTKGNLPKEFLARFDFSLARVKGEHNEANFYAAYKVLELLNIPGLPSLFQEFINEFAGVPHRLEFVLERDGLKIYNDAKSTNALATTTAIRAFKDSSEPLYLILGGKLRNESDRILPDLLPFKGRITRIYAIGEVTERIYQELNGEFEVMRGHELKSVLRQVKEEGVKGSLVFSPAFPSFDQFKNYEDRGNKFKILAREIV